MWTLINRVAMAERLPSVVLQFEAGYHAPREERMLLNQHDCYDCGLLCAGSLVQIGRSSTPLWTAGSTLLFAEGQSGSRDG